MNYIDQIYVINLKHRKDRWRNCVKQFKKHNIRNYQRFDAVKVPFHKITDAEKKNYHIQDENYICGQHGCRISHLNAIKQAKHKKYKNVLILEDDFVFSSNFIQKLIQILTSIDNASIEVNMLYLGFSIFMKHPYENTSIPNLKKLKNGFTSHAYIVNEKYYDVLISAIESNAYQIDRIYVKLQKQIDMYGVYPCIVSQQVSFSDIMKREVNYSNMIHME